MGTEEEAIYRVFNRLLSDELEYNEISRSANPYGDGVASKRIADIIEFGKIINDINYKNENICFYKC